MAYKYFTKQLVNSNFDLSGVFPDKQEIAKQQNNVSYNLSDIVIYLQDVTENFKFSDQKYVEMDNAIREIIAKHYKATNQENPFELPVEDSFNEFEQGVVPKEAAVVENNKINGKANPAPKPVKATKAAVTKPAAVEDKVAALKKQLDNLQFFYDEEEDERAGIIENTKKRLAGLEMLVEDDDADEYVLASIPLFKEFLKDK